MLMADNANLKEQLKQVTAELASKNEAQHENIMSPSHAEDDVTPTPSLNSSENEVSQFDVAFDERLDDDEDVVSSVTSRCMQTSMMCVDPDNQVN